MKISKTKKNVLYTLITSALIVALFSFCASNNSRVFADGSYANLNVANSLNATDKGLGFSQGRVWTLDKYGKYILLVQGANPGNPDRTNWVWSNNTGSTWSQGSESYSYVADRSISYDSKNDILHVIWTRLFAQDGVVYRRYTITRDGSNNITSIQQDNSVDLVLDNSTSNQFPVLAHSVSYWVDDGSTYGSLTAVWSKYNSNQNEVRASMRLLSMTADDGVASNWHALNNIPDTFSADPPAVPANLIYSNPGGRATAAMQVRGGNGLRKDDLYFFISDDSSQRMYAIRAIWDNTNKDWRGGIQSPIQIGNADINDSLGYPLKHQLISKPVLDTLNDRLYIGWVRYKAGGAGDTMSFAYLDGTDTLSSVYDVYSANGTHSGEPSFDIAYDNSGNQLYFAYAESLTNGENNSIDYVTFDGTNISSPTRYFTTNGGTGNGDGGGFMVSLYKDRTADDKILIAFRINGLTGDSIPYTVSSGYIQLSSITQTTTVVPTTTLAPTTTVVPTTLVVTTTPAPRRGDFNGNGSVNLIDLSMLLTRLGTQIDIGNASQMQIFNLDNNSSIDIVDLSIELTLLQ